MQTYKQIFYKIKQNYEELFLITVITLIGSGLRLFFILRDSFPLNDGGFFYFLIREIQKNHYALPKYSTYNHVNIPFAYPPLSFYFAGGLSDVFNIDLISLLRIIPVFFSICTIPVFYLLSKKILGLVTPAIFSSLAFALLPPSYEWQIMGGGLTRTPAYLFSIISWLISLDIEKDKSRKILLCSLFLCLTGLCHLQSLLITTVLIIITLVYKNCILQGIKLAFFVGIGCFLFMFPYILIILNNHGIQPFVSALMSGEFRLANSFGKFLLSNITDEQLFTPFLVIAFIGLGWTLSNRKYLVPVYVLAAVLFDIRSVERSVILPLSFLFGIGVFYVLLPILQKKQKDDNNQNIFPKDDRLANTGYIGLLLISYLIIRGSISAALFLALPGSSLEGISRENQSAMEWIKNNTETDSHFIILSEADTWSTDSVSEWFPALTERISLNTVQGTEWLPSNQFEKQKSIYTKLSECKYRGIDCITNHTISFNQNYDFLYISGSLHSMTDVYEISFPLESELRNDTSFLLIYSNDDVRIYKKIYDRY